MGAPRYSLRSLFIALTLIAFGAAAGIWFVRTYGPVTIHDATAEVANKTLRGYTTVPANATNVCVEYTPTSCAIIKFKLPEAETVAWCERNDWKIGADTRTENWFEFVTPRGGETWYDGEVGFVLVSD